MAFELNSIVVQGGQGKQGEAFQSLGYVTDDDKADVIATGYFNDLKGKVATNDVILVINNSGDGESKSYTLKVTGVSIQGVVSIEDITAGGSAAWPTLRHFGARRVW